MSVESIDNQALAFAALAQCAKLANDVARQGVIDNDLWQVCVSSLVCTNPNSVMDIYAPASDLASGLDTLIKQLSDSGEGRSIEITKYIAGIVSLSRKLMRNDNAMAVMSQRIDQVKRQLHHFTINDDAVISNFASIYSDIVSPLGAKINVTGTPTHLQQLLNQKKIRTLLLAGVRAAILWQQVGGKRRHLFFSRKAYVNSAKQQLTQF
ncbi:high frequency lysogenization protein HflD [Psychrobium sp. nBUS_13]|uniref:high frequency lysogenization protein HflD n=1 Tax=Psychrobium sp. nBUS_13 TaxID=3395319 RepID=UPI003EB7834B